LSKRQVPETKADKECNEFVVSALLFGGNPGKVFLKAITGRYTWEYHSTRWVSFREYCREKDST